MDGLGQSRLVAVLSLFTSGGTLLCCALPAMLVTVGAGAALSSLVSTVPQLIWLSEHKEAIFLSAGAMLAIAGLLQWRARSLPCPIDPVLAAACTRTRVFSFRVYVLLLALFLVGGFFAFVAPLLG
ncbi:MAG: hypothetical protein EXR39_18125 [Betaproteobacteria bacterium]|nr:hypothetical protein [Betaproteobacteria bacterium]